MRSLIIISSLIFVFFCFSCNYDGSIDYSNVSCEDCYIEKPEKSYLEITFSDDINDSVFIEVFKGYVDDSPYEWAGWITETSPFNLYETPVDNFYSVKATYFKDSTSISVVDADELETAFIKNYCDENCYIIKGGFYDVRLKD